MSSNTSPLGPVTSCLHHREAGTGGLGGGTTLPTTMNERFYASPHYDENNQPDGYGVWDSQAQDWYADGLTEDRAKKMAAAQNELHSRKP